ncbi:hypothetical protein A3715_19845 [Oleiphilus sp. HI0009]|nr:hypothetical protein A3715_19845 [Oleiphilus sp. HI0009]
MKHSRQALDILKKWDCINKEGVIQLKNEASVNEFKVSYSFSLYLLKKRFIELSNAEDYWLEVEVMKPVMVNFENDQGIHKVPLTAEMIASRRPKI